MKLRLIITTLILGLFLVPSTVLAQQVDIFDDICNDRPAGDHQNSTACKTQKEILVNPAGSGDDKNPLFGADGILTKIITIISILVGIGAVIGIMLGGLKFITSGSNPQEIGKSREIILYAVIGLLVAAMAQVIVRVFLNKITGT